MKKFFVFSSFLVLLLASCGGAGNSERVAVGGKYYGGVFKFMSSEKVSNLLPISSVDAYSQRLISHLFEPLLTLDFETMKVVPVVAESYSVSRDAKTFTFKIRKGVRFHDDACFGGKGREITAEDVKFSLELACSGLKINKMAYLLVDRIEGARDFQSRSKSKLPEKGVSGIKILDPYTLEISLVEPFTGFDKILCHSNLGILAHEAFEKYGKDLKIHPVGSGPFMLKSMGSAGIILERNPNYWRKDEFGNQLPFLDRVEMTYVRDKRSEIMAFRKKEIDLVLEIPVNEIENIIGSLKEAQAGMNVKHRVESKPSMSMNYIAFANESDEFKDVRVRKAFNTAIDRKAIVNQLLMGDGWAAEHGFVPSMENYHNENIKGHVFDIASAKSLMAQAGYPNGKGFPTLDFYVNAVEGSSIHRMCKGIASDLKKNLNVNLKIKLCSFDEKKKAITSGKAKIWRSGWIADYPDAENFLSLFYSKNIKNDRSEVNAFKFKDSNYDQLFEIAIKDLNAIKRNELFELCDQILIDKAAVMPILTDDFMVMINARIRDFKSNSMERIDFSMIYIKEPKE